MDSSIVVTGNLTRDPELKYSNSGEALVKFGLASTRRVKDRETTSFYDVVAFGKVAENVQESLSRGDAVIVNGRLEVRSYERKDGTQGTAVEVIANDVGALLRFATVEIRKNEKGVRRETVPSFVPEEEF